MFVVVINRHAGWVRRQSLERLTRALAARVGGDGCVVVTETLAALDAALAQIAPAQISALVPVGGDGTLSQVISRALALWGADALPPILPLCAGTMNMVARDLRAHEAPIQTITRILHQYRAGQRLQHCRRALIQSNHGRAGFVAGLGVATRFLAEYDAAGGGMGQALRQLLRYSGAALTGDARAQALFEPMPLLLRQDQQPARAQSPSVILAMSVGTLPLGFRVGSREANGLSLLIGQPNPARVAMSLPLLHRGYLPKSTGLARLHCTHLTLELAQPQPWQLDGDVLAAVTRLTLDARAQVKLLV